MTAIFETYIYQPILWLLVFIYQNLPVHDLGLAIVVLTVVVRTVLLPIFYKGAKDQTIIQNIQPHIKRIQLDHKDDKERQARELMALYKEHKVNPFSSILFLIVQLPIFIALFRVFTTETGSPLFDDHSLLGLFDLGEKNIFLTLLAAATQYFQARVMFAVKPAKADEKNAVAGNQKMMMYLGPAITLIIMLNLPSAIGLYWAVSNLFSIGQQFFINKKLHLGK
jgi:YidC/Oxa1 family membrane protein insertase